MGLLAVGNGVPHIWHWAHRLTTAGPSAAVRVPTGAGTRQPTQLISMNWFVLADSIIASHT